MPTMIPLAVSARPMGIKAKALRGQGSVPCVLYGQKTENVSLACEAKLLYKALEKAGKSQLVELHVGEKAVPVLFHDVAFDPVTDAPIHVDFYAVDLTKEVEVPVPLRFEGVSPAVRDLMGVLVVTLNHVTMRCLPTDLPADLPVSIEKLAQFGDVLTVADIVLPSHVAVLEEAATVVATVQEPRKEEEVAPPPVAEAVLAEGAPPVEGTPVAGASAEGPSPASAGSPPEKEQKKRSS